MTSFDAIFFDFDGVLADTEPVHWACWAEVLASAGVDLEWDFYHSYCIGISDDEMLRLVATRAEPPRDSTLLSALYPAKKKLFRERTVARSPFASGLVALLAALEPVYKLAVVSSSSSAEIEPPLIAWGLRRYFGTVVSGESVNRHKPDPEPYVLAAKLLRVRDALVVEDSAAGIASGRAAGFEVLRVTSAAEMPELITTRLNAARPARTNRLDWPRMY